MKTFLFNWPTLDHEFQPVSSMHAKTHLIMDKIHASTNPKIDGVCTYVYMCKQTKLKGDTRTEKTARENEKRTEQKVGHSVTLGVPTGFTFQLKYWFYSQDLAVLSN